MTLAPWKYCWCSPFATPERRLLVPEAGDGLLLTQSHALPSGEAPAGKLSSIRTLGGHRRYRADEVKRFLEGAKQQLG